MKRLPHALMAMIAATATAAASEPALPAMQIGHGEAFARGTFPARANWIGLFCAHDGCALRKTGVTIDASSALNILDEEEATEQLRFDGEPLALFADSPLPPGAVETVYRYDDANVTGPLKSTGRWQIPWSHGALTMTWTASSDGSEYTHRVSDGTRSQLLFTLPSEGHYGSDTSIPSVIWAGDLDRDGRTDLLLSLPDDNCGYDQRLYLSSRAAGDELVALSARLEGRYPACGC